MYIFVSIILKINIQKSQNFSSNFFSFGATAPSGPQPPHTRGF